ncbi:MAG TPA: hypothetical protein VJV78_40360 [Polyangiales bacterium]|nr:hypothetical protein [Polyangiales bacterium]
MWKYGWLGCRLRSAALVLCICALGLEVGAPSAHAQLITLARRVNLNVLVLSQGDVGTEMIKAGLREGGVPFTEIDLRVAGRQQITDSFLADAASLFVKRGKFQALVAPNEAPAQLSAAENTALQKYQREFKVRRFDAYVYPTGAVGLGAPVFAGPFDGMTADVNASGKANHFGYLNGPVPFENVSAEIAETWGYLAPPMAADTVNKRSFTSYVDVPIPGSSSNGVLLGVLNDNGREEMVLTCAINQYQFQQQALFQGILNWLTYGVHLGTERNYFTMHVDDVFLSDARWSQANNCTVGDDCAPSVVEPEILMTPADVDYAIAWQTSNNFKFDMVYNGAGHAEMLMVAGAYPLGTRLIQAKSSFRWVNHTYTHMYLGCIQDFSTVPFHCATDGAGKILWTTYADVDAEIDQNIAFATAQGLPITRGELVTGEHSGLRRTPQEPSDNPNLATALNSDGIAWIASDNSRESTQRSIGNARTVPRYPMNIYYNTATKAEAVDEYNWIYTSVANGGSGLCENNPLSTCISPLDPATSFDSYIVPIEARIAMLHVLSNSPRPHYAHQSNLAEDRILYPVLNKLLADYRSVFATTAAVVNPTMTQAGTELKNLNDWNTTRSRVTAYIQSGQVTFSVSGLGSVNIPVTLPSAGGSVPSTVVSYGGYRTGWRSSSGSASVSLPSTVGYAR